MFGARKSIALSAAGAVVIAIGIGGASPASAEPHSVAAGNSTLSASDAAQLDRVLSEYRVGQPFSPEDEAFVRAVSTPLASTGSRAAATCFNQSRSGGGNGTGNVNGCHGMNYTPGITHNWAVDYRATGNANVKKVVAREHVRVYGVIGSGGFGIVYSADPSGTVTGSQNTFSRGASFSAIGTNWTMQYDATFTTSSGSFSVTG
jgi:hypothetical protein